MRNTTFWDRIKDFFLWPFREIEWRCTQRWLNNTFGKQEYWGEKISELFAAQRELENQKAKMDENLKQASKIIYTPNN